MESHPQSHGVGFVHAFLQGCVALGELFLPQDEMTPGFKGFRMIEAGKSARFGIGKHFVHVFRPEFTDQVGAAGLPGCLQPFSVQGGMGKTFLYFQSADGIQGLRSVTGKQGKAAAFDICVLVVHCRGGDTVFGIFHGFNTVPAPVFAEQLQHASEGHGVGGGRNVFDIAHGQGGGDALGGMRPVGGQFVREAGHGLDIQGLDAHRGGASLYHADDVSHHIVQSGYDGAGCEEIKL